MKGGCDALRKDNVIRDEDYRVLQVQHHLVQLGARVKCSQRVVLILGRS